MRIGSAFSGIGCFEYGVQQVLPASSVQWQIEIEEFPRRVLEKHWPDADRSVIDIRDAAGISKLEPIDLLLAGWPCTDISRAGKMEGLDGKRSGLWYELLNNIICKIRPPFIIMENVDAVRTIHGGSVYGEVLNGLDAARYNVEWHSLSARDVGAPHKRARWWAICWRQDLTTKDVANTKSLWPRESEHCGNQEGLEGSNTAQPDSSSTDVANANGQPNATNRGQCENAKSQGAGWRDDKARGHADAGWQGSNDSTRQDQGTHLANPTGIGVEGHRRIGQQVTRSQVQKGVSGCNSARSGASHWHTEPDLGRLVTRPATRLSRYEHKQALKALGNGIVPQCAMVIAMRLVEIIEELSHADL